MERCGRWKWEHNPYRTEQLPWQIAGLLPWKVDLTDADVRKEWGDGIREKVKAEAELVRRNHNQPPPYHFDLFFIKIALQTGIITDEVGIMYNCHDDPNGIGRMMEIFDVWLGKLLPTFHYHRIYLSGSWYAEKTDPRWSEWNLFPCGIDPILSLDKEDHEKGLQLPHDPAKGLRNSLSIGLRAVYSADTRTLVRRELWNVDDERWAALRSLTNPAPHPDCSPCQALRLPPSTRPGMLTLTLTLTASLARRVTVHKYDDFVDDTTFGVDGDRRPYPLVKVLRVFEGRLRGPSAVPITFKFFLQCRGSDLVQVTSFGAESEIRWSVRTHAQTARPR